MQVGVISDTHGNVSAWKKAMRLFGNVDLILHAGDVLYHPPRILPGEGYNIPELARLIDECPVPVVIARGNCDAEVYSELLKVPVLSPYAFVSLEKRKVLVTHGHEVSPELAAELVRRYSVDVLVTGHTHVPVLDRIQSAVHINPGSPSHPKLEREGVLVPTVGLMTEECARILELETGQEIAVLPFA